MLVWRPYLVVVSSTQILTIKTTITGMSGLRFARAMRPYRLLPGRWGSWRTAREDCSLTADMQIRVRQSPILDKKNRGLRCMCGLVWFFLNKFVELWSRRIDIWCPLLFHSIQCYFKQNISQTIFRHPHIVVVILAAIYRYMGRVLAVRPSMADA